MEIERKPLIEELTWAARFVESKSTIPILQHVALWCTRGKLAIEGTDLECGARTYVRVSHGGTWTITVPPKPLLNYLKQVDEDSVSLSVEDSNLVVSHGSSKSTVSGLEIESYPDLPKPPKTDSLDLSGLTRATKRVQVAISKEESRFTLNGALLDIDERGAKLVATDGHRLALQMMVSSKVDKLRVLLPAQAIREVAALKLDECSFSHDEHHAFFDFGVRQILTRKLTGNFPNYERVMPQQYAHSAVIERDSLQKALKRIAVFINPSDPHRTIRWKVAEGVLNVSTRGETGSASASFDSVNTNGAAIEIGLNLQYVADVLAVGPEQFTWFFTEPASAVEFGTDDGFSYVLMPIRI